MELSCCEVERDPPPRAQGSLEAHLPRPPACPLSESRGAVCRMITRAQLCTQDESPLRDFYTLPVQTLSKCALDTAHPGPLTQADHQGALEGPEFTSVNHKGP